MIDKMHFDVVGLGSCAVDYLGMVPEFPMPDSKNQLKKFTRQGGGPVATALVSLARLGSSTTFLGKLGSDELSAFVLDDFAREGVDINNVEREEGATPYFAFVVADESSGKRTIWWTDEGVSQMKADEVKKEVIASGRFLLIDEYQFEAALEASRIAREAGVQVVLDAETPGKPGMDRLVRGCDILIAPDEFACAFTGEEAFESSSRVLHGMGPRVVVVTLGVEGSFCRTKDDCFHQPAFQVEAVDTTGCGDVFHGAFIYGMLQSWSLRRIAEFANAAAALNCRELGGRAGAPILREVRDFLDGKGQFKKGEV